MKRREHSVPGLDPEASKAPLISRRVSLSAPG